MVSIKRLNIAETDFWNELDQMTAWSALSDDQVVSSVRSILDAVRQQGDSALLKYTRQFDEVEVDSVSALEIDREEMRRATENLPADIRQSLQTAADRIRSYHEKQMQGDWSYEEPDGTVLGQKVTPMDRVGLYVPGGKAAYPSTVLMTAIPARVAGVGEVIATMPTPGGEKNSLALAAADIAGVDRLFTVGGAQAIGAMTWGTETIPRVDKIVGPGNIYVATAKSLVFGEVGLDMVAGPSEILVICDGKTDPDWIAMDLFSQAEHDEQAQAILVSPDAGFLTAVEQAMARLLPGMERQGIIEASLKNRGLLIEVENLEQAVEVSNRLAPEHLEVSVDDPEALLPGIRNAGAIFLGRYSSEALGDYVAGPSHVLPTSTTARFSSPLGVYDFQKRSSIIHCSAEAAASLGKVASDLARGESLTAHARSAEFRIPEKE
jgi:histidinol dehydrogenase